MKLKKVLAAILAATMVMGTSLTVFAAPGEKPTENDYLDVSDKITSIESEATINAYQVIDAVYNDNGFVKYVWVAGDKAGEDVKFDSNGNVIGLTSDYITNLAANTEGLTTADVNSLPAGTWMLLVTGSELGKVYNPMIISVYYSVSGSDGTMDTDGVDASKNWTLETNGAYVKSQNVEIEKTVDNTDDDTAEVGDIKTFTIKGEIPSYSKNSTALYKITDEITNGLNYVIADGSTVIAPTVTIGGVSVPTEKYTVTMGQNNKSFTIEFKAEYIKELAAVGTNRNLVITYQAEVTEDAITAVAENKATVDYDQGSFDSTEYVYTVNFDGAAKKVGVGEDEEGLAEATFTLYDTWTDSNNDTIATADELTGKVGESTTSEENNFDIEFKGLDATKTYYLTETNAPGGYTINNTVYTITFGNVVTNGANISYDILVNGNKVGSVTTYNGAATDSTFEIENTKLSDLPSTGGIGTTIFTIGGCAIMITAAGLYFVSRRKESK